MEKKQYITPEMEVMELESESLMLTVSGAEVDTEDDGFIQRSGNRRGTWGNLWYTEN